MDGWVDVMMVERGRAVFASSTGADWADRSNFEFVLVSSPAAYVQAVSAGAQPILPSARFSETDSRGALRRFLGPLNMAWRWRRYLLNEGITEITVPRVSTRSLPLIGGALLAGSRFRLRSQS